MEKGDYKVIGSYKNKETMYTVKCKICGYIKDVTTYNFNKNSMKHTRMNCKEDYDLYCIGCVFGDYKIIKKTEEKNLSNEYYFIGKCEKCGIEIKRTISQFKKFKYKHGDKICFNNLTENEYKKVVLQRFYNMYQRCNNKNNSNYAHYGARGIKLEYKYAIDLYFDFIDELKAHSSIYGIKNSTFDRIDVDGNYCKSNLRITTQKVQSTNTTREKYFILTAGEKLVLSNSAMECGRVLGINGRSVGNVVRGQSKTCGGWRLHSVYNSIEEIENPLLESVTTKVIV